MILDIYKDSLEYSAKDFKILLILGACYLLSFLILPMFLIYGYSFRVTKISVEGMINGNDPLPTFDDVIGMFIDGIKVVLIYIIYLLVPFVIFLLFTFVSNAIGGTGAAALMAIGSLITLIAIIFAYLMSMMAVANMANYDGSLSKAFDFKEIFEIIKSIGVGRCIATYIGLMIIGLALYLVVFLLISLIFGFFGIFAGTLGHNMAAGGIFIAGYFLSNFVILFIIGPFLDIFQSRTCGLLYNLH